MVLSPPWSWWLVVIPAVLPKELFCSSSQSQYPYKKLIAGIFFINDDCHLITRSRLSLWLLPHVKFPFRERYCFHFGSVSASILGALRLPFCYHKMLGDLPRISLNWCFLIPLQKLLAGFFSKKMCLLLIPKSWTNYCFMIPWNPYESICAWFWYLLMFEPKDPVGWHSFL